VDLRTDGWAAPGSVQMVPTLVRVMSVIRFMGAFRIRRSPATWGSDPTE
jgi:hypothetical protein